MTWPRIFGSQIDPDTTITASVFLGTSLITGSLLVVNEVHTVFITSSTDVVSGSLQVSGSLTVNGTSVSLDGHTHAYSTLTGIPGGIVSSSGQVDYTGLSNIPGGIVSSSGQVDYTGLSNIPGGIVSGSGQVDHNSTLNYDPDRHYDHTAISVLAGDGMSGGGTIASDRTLTLDTGSNHFIQGVLDNASPVPEGTVSSSAQISALGFVEDTRQLTINGTANEVEVTGGAQTLAADRTWTVGLPNDVTLGGGLTLTTYLTGSSTATWRVRIPVGTDLYD